MQIGGDWLSVGNLNADRIPDVIASSVYFNGTTVANLSEGPKKWKFLLTDGDDRGAQWSPEGPNSGSRWRLVDDSPTVTAPAPPPMTTNHGDTSDPDAQNNGRAADAGAMAVAGAAEVHDSDELGAIQPGAPAGNGDGKFAPHERSVLPTPQDLRMGEWPGARSYRRRARGSWRSTRTAPSGAMRSKSHDLPVWRAPNRSRTLPREAAGSEGEGAGGPGGPSASLGAGSSLCRAIPRGFVEDDNIRG